MKTVKGLLGWLTKNWDSGISESFGWCNVGKELTEQEIGRIKSYLEKKKEHRFFFIINGVNQLRPQRTYGGLPEWVRSNSAYHAIYHDANAFVFVGCEKDDEAELSLVTSAVETAKEADAKICVCRKQ